MGPKTYLVDTSFSMSPHKETIQQIAELCGHPDPKSIKCKGGTKIGPSIDKFFLNHDGLLQDFVLVTDAEDGGFNDPDHILKTVEDIKARYPGIEIHLILNNPDLLPKLLQQRLIFQEPSHLGCHPAPRTGGVGDARGIC